MRTEENRKNTDKNRKIILGTVCGVMLITTAVAAAKIKVVVSEKNDLASRTCDNFCIYNYRNNYKR